MPINYSELYERFNRTKQPPAEQLSKLRGEFFSLALSVASATEGTHEGARAVDALEDALSLAERGIARFDRDR